MQRQSETTTSGDGLTVSVDLDADGDGTFEQQSASVRAINADGSSTETVTDNLNGGLLARTVTTKSADGRLTTIERDPAGIGSTTETRTIATDTLADGTVLVTTSTYDGLGVLKDRRIEQTSGDKHTVTVTVDANGDGVTDHVETTTNAVDGSSTVVVTDFGAAGVVTGKSTVVQSFDGLTTTTTSDIEGDGILDRSATDVVVQNIDGSSVETLQLYQTSQRNPDGTVSSITPVLIRKVITTSSADGRTITTTTDLDGVGTPDETSTTTLGIDGSQSTLTTDDATIRCRNGAELLPLVLHCPVPGAPLAHRTL